jgi:acyl-CoA synthetase (AMP-forming)/AMP-acid ligase II
MMLSAERLPGDPVRNIAEQLSLHARHRPSRIAVQQGETRISYLELDRAVRQRAAALLDRGVRPGDLVGVALDDSIEHLLTLWALARAGAVILPFDCRWLALEKERLAAHFEPAVVLVEPGMAFAGVPCLEIDETWQQRVKSASSEREFADGDRGLVLSLSSGTTGRPKGPMVSHHKFASRFWTHFIDLGFGSRETYLNATPLYFGGGRSFCMSTLYAGGTVVLLAPPYTPAELAHEVERSSASVLFLVPTLLRRLLGCEGDELLPFRRLKVLVSSGSALAAEERAQIRARICPNFVEFYSSTEGGGITVLSPDDQRERPGSVGRAVFGVSLQVVGETHQPLAAGEIGRIRYRGAAVADGFHRDPEASAEAFREGWYYPGDLGALDDDGFLYLKGRAKDMIIRGGINIHPQDIEAVLLEHAGVADAAVVGWPSVEFNEEVAAFVVVRGAVDPQALREHCRSRLAPYKVPREVFLVEELPKNSLGKVVKSELCARLPAL